jgi:hypothetical protein
LAIKRLHPIFERRFDRASILGPERVLGGQHAMGPCDHPVGTGKGGHFGEELIAHLGRCVGREYRFVRLGVRLAMRRPGAGCDGRNGLRSNPGGRDGPTNRRHWRSCWHTRPHCRSRTAWGSVGWPRASVASSSCDKGLCCFRSHLTATDRTVPRRRSTSVLAKRTKPHTIDSALRVVSMEQIVDAHLKGFDV